MRERAPEKWGTVALLGRDGGFAVGAPDGAGMGVAEGRRVGGELKVNVGELVKGCSPGFVELR